MWNTLKERYRIKEDERYEGALGLLMKWRWMVPFLIKNRR